MLIYIDPKQDHRRRVVVPDYLKQQILAEHHSSPMGGHIAAKKTYGSLIRHWWWHGMYSDTHEFTWVLPAVHSCDGQRTTPSTTIAPHPYQLTLEDSRSRIVSRGQAFRNRKRLVTTFRGRCWNVTSHSEHYCAPCAVQLLFSRVWLGSGIDCLLCRKSNQAKDPSLLAPCGWWLHMRI